jgi:hypothetical protein
MQIFTYGKAVLAVAWNGLILLLAPEAGPFVLGLQLRVRTVIARTKVRTRVGEVVDCDALGCHSGNHQALHENLACEYNGREILRVGLLPAAPRAMNVGYRLH